jgi:hypothetical protein
LLASIESNPVSSSYRLVLGLTEADIKIITYELLGLVIERSSNIVSLFKELENIRIDA